MISTRRLFARPSAVRLSATGRLCPRPFAEMISEGTPRDAFARMRALGVSQLVVATTTEQPLALTPVQRQTIYRTIVQAPAVVEAPPPTVEYRVGMRVPPSAQLYTVPQAVVTEVPAIRTYRYMVVNHHVVLVDPATSEVVAELAD